MREVSPRTSGRWLTFFYGTNVLSTTTCQQLCWGMTHFPRFPFKRFGYVFSAYILAWGSICALLQACSRSPISELCLYCLCWQSTFSLPGLLECYPGLTRSKPLCFLVFSHDIFLITSFCIMIFIHFFSQTKFNFFCTLWYAKTVFAERGKIVLNELVEN